MNNTEKYFVNGDILAGGQNARMGVEKGLMQLNGKPIVQYVIEQFQPLAARVVIVSNKPKYEKYGLQVVGDLIKDMGPAGGIFTASNHSDAQQNFIVYCDMPYLKSDTITFIVEHSNQSQIAVSLRRYKLQLLFGVYSTASLSKGKELIENEVIILQDLLEHFNLITLNVEGNEIINE